MRKTLLLISAVFAMLAAVSCNKEELNNVDVPQTSVESLEFIAYTDVATKTTLNGVKTEWESGDEIAINGVCYFTEDEGTMAKFIKDPSEEGNPGVPFYAVYPYYAKMDEGEYVIDFLSSGNTTLTAGSIGDDVISIAYSESEHELNFKNVVSLIKFQVPAEGISEIRISATENLAGELTVDYNGGEEPKVTDVSKGQKELVLTASEGTFAVRTDYYVPVLPGAKTNLTVKIDGTVVAEGKSIEFKRSKIHYLGTLPSVPEPDPVTIYLKPGVWGLDNAWFAAHFWVGESNEDVMMTDSDSDGIYEVEVPAGMENVIFCRMNPEYDTFGWDVKEGETVVEDHVWDQSEDLDVPGVGDDKAYYVINDWASGEWMTYEDATTEPVAIWGIAGNFNGWNASDANYHMTYDNDGWYEITGVKLLATDEFKFVTNNSWDNSLGGLITAENGTEYSVSNTNDNLKVKQDGVYKIRLNPNTKKFSATRTGNIPVNAEGNWYLVGAFQGWDAADKTYKMLTEGEWFVYRNFTLDAAYEVKLLENNSWDINRGGTWSSINTAISVSQNGANILVPKGTYDVYMNANNTKVWFMEPGSVPAN